MSKKRSATTILNNTEGPTSIFISSRDSHPGILERFRRSRQKNKRAKIEKSITAHPHTLEEVTKFIKSNYDSRECFHSSRYSFEKTALRASLIIEHHPSLLGELSFIKEPQTDDEQSLREYFKTLDLQWQRALSLPEDVLPLDFHLYELFFHSGQKMEVIIENNWDILRLAYSGSGKGLKEFQKISKEIYLFYGVSDKDIEEKSDRYLELITALL